MVHCYPIWLFVSPQMRKRIFGVQAGLGSVGAINFHWRSEYSCERFVQ